MWTRRLTAAFAVALISERLWLSNAAGWLVGALCMALILARGRSTERVCLVLLCAVALIAPDDQLRNAARYCVYFALFAVSATQASLDPRIHLALQATGVVASLLVGAPVEKFVFGTSVALLIVGISNADRARNVEGMNPKREIRWRWVAASGATSIVGYGSRSALIVVATLMARRRTGLFLIATSAALGVATLVPHRLEREVPIAYKLATSATELLVPGDENSGFNLRALELEVFGTYVERASVVELLFGARQPIYLPGNIWGDGAADVQYLPHNFLFGITYQLGCAGAAIVAALIAYVYRRLRARRTAAFVFVAAAIPFLLFKGGYLDTDFALMCASLNWVLRGET